MRTQNETVSTKHGDSFEFEMPMPESVEEAVNVYGEENALDIFNSGLKVKLQNTARDKFRAGKSRTEVEDAVKNWRPGAFGGKKSPRNEVFEILTERADEIQNDPNLKDDAKTYVAKGQYKNALTCLKEGLGLG